MIPPWCGSAVCAGLIAGATIGWGIVVKTKLTEDPGSLDAAQRAFEGNFEKSRGYNWPWFHQRRFGMSIDCFDYESLRICTVNLPTISPDGAKGITQRETFACSRFTCAWAVIQ